jgi:hypothetical protein
MQVFISYAKEDHESALKLFKSLSMLDEISPWLDTEYLLPGMNWEDEIINAIEKSQYFIAIISSNSIDKTGFVQKEMRIALDRLQYFPTDKIFLIPVRLDICDAKFRILKNIQYVDLFPDWDKGFDKILKVITEQIQARLTFIFSHLQTHMTIKQQDEWIILNEDYIGKFKAKPIIEFLNKKYEKFNEEFFALNLLVKIAYRKQSDAMLSYLIRIHEIGAMATRYPIDLATGYGIALETSKLLPDDVRAMYLREIFQFQIANIDKHITYDFTLCILLVEITKHYMCERRMRFQSDFEIVREALKRLQKYDLLFLDLALFYSIRSKNYDIILDIFPILAKRLNKRIDFEIPQISDKWFLKSSSFNMNKMEIVESNAKTRIASLLLRMSQYLTYHENEAIRNFGIELRKYFLSLEYIENSEIIQMIENLDSKEAIVFFDKLERYDWINIKVYCGINTTTLQKIIDLMTPFCSTHEKDEQRSIWRPISLSDDALSGEMFPDIILG